MSYVTVNNIQYAYPAPEFGRTDFQRKIHYANLGWLFLDSAQRPQTIQQLGERGRINDGAQNAVSYMSRINNLFQKGYKINIKTREDFEFLENPINERLLKLNDFDIERTKLAIISEKEQKRLQEFENLLIKKQLELNKIEKEFEIIDPKISKSVIEPEIVKSSINPYYSLIPLGILGILLLYTRGGKS